MKPSLILGTFLTFGTVLAVHGQQAPAGYVSIDDLEVDKGTPAVIVKPAETPAAKPAAVQSAKAPQTPKAAEPVAPAEPVKVAEAAKPAFEAKQGASLRETLDRWARAAGWKSVTWKLPADVDFTLGVGGTYEGDFMNATRSFVDALGCEAELRVLFNPTTKVALVEPI